MLCVFVEFREGAVFRTLKACYPTLVNQRRVLQQHDNAATHIANVTKCKPESLEALQVLPQTTYSLTLHHQINTFSDP